VYVDHLAREPIQEIRAQQSHEPGQADEIRSGLRASSGQCGLEVPSLSISASFNYPARNPVPGSLVECGRRGIIAHNDHDLGGDVTVGAPLENRFEVGTAP
jgi:hypothetical protein